MTDKEKIIAEIERLKRWNDNVRESTRHMTVQEEDYNRGKNSSYLELLEFINSLPEEPVSEDLNEAAIMHYKDVMEYEAKTGLKPAYMTSFKAGAQWQKEQMTKDSIDAEVSFRMLPDSKGFVSFDTCFTDLCFNEGDKVKLIILKED